MTEIEWIKKRLSYAENNNLFDAHYISDMNSLITTIESQKEEIEFWKSESATQAQQFLDADSQVDSLKAITELAVTCLQRIDSIRETFPISFQPHHVEAAFIKAERLTTVALEEIARLSHEQT